MDGLDGDHTLKRRRPRLKELERNKAVLLEEYAGMMADAIEELIGEERH